MTNEQALMMVIAIGIAVAAAICIAIPRLVAKGVNVGGIIGTASAGLAKADTAVGVLLEAAPGNEGLLMLDKVVDWSRQAVAAAEQLYKTHQLDGDERKAAAANLVHQFAAAAGIEVTDPLAQVIDGSIEAAVLWMPKTGMMPPEPEPSESA